MPRRPSPPSTPRAIHISSPILRSPTPAHFEPSTSPSPFRTPPSSRSGRKRDAIDGLGLGMRENEYALTHSPTHDYLETFDSYPTSPDPNHIPIPQSPSNLDFHSPSEKDGLNDDSYQFGKNQYDSNRYLSPALPSQANTSRSNRSASGARSRGGRAMDSNEKYKQPRGCVPTNPTKRRWLFFGVPIGLILIAGIAVGVTVGVSKANQSKSSGSGSGASVHTNGTSGSGSGGKGSSGNDTVNYGIAASGKDGSTVSIDDGSSFIYTNKFGGGWAVDPYKPYTVSGRAQSWTPSLLEKWQWGFHIVRGVNLGGWLVTEPFIVPGLYEQYQTTTPKAEDEYSLSQAMGKDLATKMEEHYRTFITEEDFAEIASAGLNWVRIPLGYWAIETTEDEPYLGKVSWTYFLKAIGWARKYGLRILLDFHALPGSQNGWNHSGKGGGSINWMYGVMGIANAQRHLEQIRSLAEFISQPGIKEVVPMMSLVNEVQASIVGQDVMASFYYQAYELIRSITGLGEGNGPIIAIHEGFLGVAQWQDFLSGADRLSLDQHPYLAFGDPNNNSWEVNAKTACGWGGGTNDSQTNFGITIGGEWSNAINNCGKWLTGVGTTPSYVTAGLGTCDRWEDWQHWDDTMKAGIKGYSMANMDALQNWFFWTWKIGNSTEVGYATSPMWHYRLGWKNGWMPDDPRAAGGYCNRVLQVGGNQFAGTHPASATGGAPSATIAADQVAKHSIWPPTSIGPSFTAAQIALFPTLTQTGQPLVLPTASHPANATNIGSGWANPSDTTGAWVRVNGCPYLDEYSATAGPVPTALCTGTKAKRQVAIRAMRTAAPVV